jgi:hypothetical protein
MPHRPSRSKPKHQAPLADAGLAPQAKPSPSGAGLCTSRKPNSCAVGAVGAGTVEGAIRRSPSPKPLNMSRGSRRGANTAAPPINNPGMSAASKIAAPAATAPSAATLPTTPGPKTELGDQLLACTKDVVKEVSLSSALPSGDTGKP